MTQLLTVSLLLINSLLIRRGLFTCSAFADSKEIDMDHQVGDNKVRLCEFYSKKDKMNTCQNSIGSKGTSITDDITTGEASDSFLEWDQYSTLDSKHDDSDNIENCTPSSLNIPTISPHSSTMSSPSRRRWTKFDIRAMIPPLRNPFKNDMAVQDLSNLTPLCNGSHSRIIRAVYQGKRVILKTLSDDSMHRKIAHRDFETEVNVLSRISHPHIINIVASGFNFSESLGMWRPLIALEYLQGNSLAYHLDTRQSTGVRPFNERQYLCMGRQLASALDYLHRGFHPDCLLIHRDLKPDNIAFTADGTLKLIDFGLCTAIRRGASSTGNYLATGTSAK